MDSLCKRTLILATQKSGGILFERTARCPGSRSVRLDLRTAYERVEIFFQIRVAIARILLTIGRIVRV